MRDGDFSMNSELEQMRQMQQERASSSSPASGSVLDKLNAAVKNFDMELWHEQDSSCLLCHAAMSLDVGAEWPDDPRLLLCWSCMSHALRELLPQNAPGERPAREKE